MVSQNRDLSALTESVLGAVPQASWQSASDLSRISIDAMSTATNLGRQMVSIGVLRLTGLGVQSSLASLEAVGEFMTRWQKLITSIGGAKRGFKGLRGRMNTDVVSATKLLLNAGPSEGSLMLEFQPEKLPAEELSPTGDVGLFDEADTQLADESVVEALSLFRSAATIGPDADASEFLAEVSELGARAASALAELAKSVDSSGFDLDVSWRQPEHPTDRVFLRNADARRIVDIVTSRELDSDIEVLTGYIQTISDRARLHLLLDDGDLVSISPGNLDHEALRPIHHGDRVDIEVDVKMTHRPGEEPAASYIARSIHKRS